MLKTNVTVARAEMGQVFGDKKFCVVTFTANIFGMLGTSWEEPMFRAVTSADGGSYIPEGCRWSYLDSGQPTNEDMHRAIEAHLTLEAAHD